MRHRHNVGLLRSGAIPVALPFADAFSTTLAAISHLQPAGKVREMSILGLQARP